MLLDKFMEFWRFKMNSIASTLKKVSVRNLDKDLKQGKY